MPSRLTAFASMPAISPSLFASGTLHWRTALRPSTARLPSAQDEVIRLMPSTAHLILSSVAAKRRCVSKDARSQCNLDGDGRNSRADASRIIPLGCGAFTNLLHQTGTPD